MANKKAPVMQLPAEQQALLTGLRPRLRSMANSLHWRYFFGRQLITPEDLLQEGWLAMLKAGNYPVAEPEQLMRWAYTILRSKAEKLQSKLLREMQSSGLYLQEQAYHAIVPYSGEEKVAYLFRMAQRHLRPVVNQVLLGYGLGHSGKQIAARLGIPPATVRQHFHTAKKRLQELNLTAVQAWR